MKLIHLLAIGVPLTIIPLFPAAGISPAPEKELENNFWEQVNVISSGLHMCKDFISPGTYGLYKKNLRSVVDLVTKDNSQTVILLHEINEKLRSQFPDPAAKARNDHRVEVEKLIEKQYAALSSASKEQALSQQALDHDIDGACENTLEEHFEEIEFSLAKMGLL